METSQDELDNERRRNTDEDNRFSTNEIFNNIYSTSPPRAAMIVDYQNQLEKLQENFTRKENEQTLFSQQLQESESKFQKILADHALKCEKYEEDLQSLLEQRNSLLDQQVLHSEEQ